jgi:hypothetical protein
MYLRHRITLQLNTVYDMGIGWNLGNTLEACGTNQQPFKVMKIMGQYSYKSGVN